MSGAEAARGRAQVSGRLRGKVAVITGTAHGQGREAALRFAKEGARVVGCDLEADGAAETVKLVRAAGGDMISLQPLDLADESEVRRLIAEAEQEFGGIDILYNNAAAARPGGSDQSREDFEFTMRNELTIVWLGCKVASEAFRRRGHGVIINVASVSGITGSGFVGNHPMLFGHAVAKSAVIRLTEVLAIALASDGVRVNALSPGIIETELTADFLDEQMTDLWMDNILLGRLGRPSDVVGAAIFLASDEAAYVTGTNLIVDGGWSVSGGRGREDSRIQIEIDRILAGVPDQRSSSTG